MVHLTQPQPQFARRHPEQYEHHLGQSTSPSASLSALQPRSRSRSRSPGDSSPYPADVDIEAQANGPPSSDDHPENNHRGKHHVEIAEPEEHKPSEGTFSLPSFSNPVRVGTATSRLSLRRRGRAESVTAYGAAEMGRATGWAPGLEPGIDTSDPAPPYRAAAHLEREGHKLNQKCEITIVDYSVDDIELRYFDNENLEEFLTSSKSCKDESTVRWINVNGLSWDVIRAIGNHKKLHRLAIEDLMNTRNRTKVDWYSDHTFMIMPLQRLVYLQTPYDDRDDDDDDDLDEKAQASLVDAVKLENMAELQRRRKEQFHRRRRRGPILALLDDIMRPQKRKRARIAAECAGKLTTASSFKNPAAENPWTPVKVRTLQRYHGGPNQDRIEFMERHSVLGSRGLAISIEQVSVFLCADNTVISFFEYSSQAIEDPILTRLQSDQTILRESCDASMLAQGIMDAIIDLAIPVTTAYQDAIGDLEVDVLTSRTSASPPNCTF